MARVKKGTEDNLTQQIEKMQEKVIRTKAAYDKAVSDLQKLLDKRDAKRKEELWDAVIKSDRSYEEIMHLIRNDNFREDPE